MLSKYRIVLRKQLFIEKESLEYENWTDWARKRRKYSSTTSLKTISFKNQDQKEHSSNYSAIKADNFTLRWWWSEEDDEQRAKWFFWLEQMNIFLVGVWVNSYQLVGWNCSFVRSFTHNTKYKLNRHSCSCLWCENTQFSCCFMFQNISF